MKKAAEAVKNKDIGHLKASITFNVRTNIQMMCLYY